MATMNSQIRVHEIQILEIKQAVFIYIIKASHCKIYSNHKVNILINFVIWISTMIFTWVTQYYFYLLVRTLKNVIRKRVNQSTINQRAEPSKGNWLRKFSRIININLFMKQDDKT